MTLLPPALYLVVAALACAVLPNRLSALLIPLAAGATLMSIQALPEGNLIEWSFLSYQLHPLHVDAMSRIVGIIFEVITGLAGIYGLTLFSRGEQVAALLYAAGALGATFAGDYFTFYFAWELMAVASFVLIAARPDPASQRASVRYFFVHLTGGMLLIAGILMEVAAGGTLRLNPFAQAGAGLGAWLILGGVAVNAAVVPLHAWLTDSYPKATIGGAVLLSALTTKTAVYAMARLFPGWEILIILGVIMTVYGVIFAFLADDIRTVLAYHIVSQVGFMVAGVGLGTEMALNGAIAHAFCHILYKSLLFMGTGAVLYATGASRLSQLGGLYRALPVVFLLYMVAAVSISGVPLFNGFTSKSMTISAAEHIQANWTVTLFYVASVGTFLSVGLKLPYFAWFGSKQSEHKVQVIPQPMYLAMGLTALLCVVLGVYPDLLYRALPFPVDYEPFTRAHIIHASWYLLGTGLAFALYLPWIKMKRTYLRDTDAIYRQPAGLYEALFVTVPGRIFGWIEQGMLRLVAALTALSRNPSLAVRSWRTPERPYDPDAQRLPLAWTVSAILGSFVLLAVWILFGTL